MPGPLELERLWSESFQLGSPKSLQLPHRRGQESGSGRMLLFVPCLSGRAIHYVVQEPVLTIRFPAGQFGQSGCGHAPCAGHGLRRRSGQWQTTKSAPVPLRETKRSTSWRASRSLEPNLLLPPANPSQCRTATCQPACGERAHPTPYHRLLLPYQVSHAEDRSETSADRSRCATLEQVQ